MDLRNRFGIEFGLEEREDENDWVKHLRYFEVVGRLPVDGPNGIELEVLRRSL